MADESNGRVVRLGKDAGRSVILVDGVVQSVAPVDSTRWGGYWQAMVPPFKPKHALILGLGGATIPHILVQRWGEDVATVGVDDDPSILLLAEQTGWLAVPGLEVVRSDAFDYVATCRQRFDYVAIDLYRGLTFNGRSLTKPILQRLRDLMDPPGWLAVNLFVDRYTSRRLDRLRRVFRLEQTVEVGSNIVVHARGRP
jgi:spermidine synthase